MKPASDQLGYQGVVAGAWGEAPQALCQGPWGAAEAGAVAVTAMSAAASGRARTIFLAVMPL